MEFKFSKDGEKNLRPEPAVEIKNQRALLVLLLLLVGGFSYVYFFTGVIKPLEVPKSAEAPATQIVKMALPPRDGAAGKADSKSTDVKREAAVPPKADLPKMAKPSPVAAALPVVKTQVQPSRPDIKRVSEVAETKAKASSKSEKPLKTEVGSTDAVGAWSILVGSYVLEDALSNDMVRLRKAGFVPVITPGPRKKSEMSRLVLSEFADRSAAKAAFDKLQRHTSDAFIVDQAGKHTVYAGSYLLDVHAAFEMERLSAAGFPVSLKRVEVAIPSKNLTLGPFKNKKSADAVLGKLKAAGIKASISRR